MKVEPEARLAFWSAAFIAVLNGRAAATSGTMHAGTIADADITATAALGAFEAKAKELLP